MADASTGTRVVILLDDGRDPPEGLLEADGQEQPFVGWLGLISAISQALERVKGAQPRADS